MQHSTNETVITVDASNLTTPQEKVELILQKIQEVSGWVLEDGKLYLNEEKTAYIKGYYTDNNLGFPVIVNNVYMGPASDSGSYIGLANYYTIYWHCSIDEKTQYCSINRHSNSSWLIAENTLGNKTLFVPSGGRIYFSPFYRSNFKMDITKTPTILVDFPYSIYKAVDYCDKAAFPELYLLDSSPVALNVINGQLVIYDNTIYRLATLGGITSVAFAFPVNQ